jgi:hypothetical protein
MSPTPVRTREEPMSELPPESPPEDVVEQRTEIYPDRPSRTALRDDQPLEADPADAADQADELPLDEDDYQ